MSRRAMLSVCAGVALLLGAAVELGGQEAGKAPGKTPKAPAKTATTPAKAAAPPAKTVAPVMKAEALTAEESFALLKELNDNQKLFPESYLMPITGYKDLKMETCFGVRLANGQRLAGESSGKSYGLRGTKSAGPYVAIGALYAEFVFAIEGKVMPMGPYVVQAYLDTLELSGNDEKETRYDYQRQKDVPVEKALRLKLKTAVAAELLAEEAKEVPRFTVSAENGAIVLALGENRWRVVAQPR